MYDLQSARLNDLTVSTPAELATDEHAGDLLGADVRGVAEISNTTAPTFTSSPTASWPKGPMRARRTCMSPTRAPRPCSSPRSAGATRTTGVKNECPNPLARLRFRRLALASRSSLGRVLRATTTSPRRRAIAPRTNSHHLNSRMGLSSAPCKEVFLYDAGAGSLTCVSCDPSGARPVGPSTLGEEVQRSASFFFAPATRQLAADGPARPSARDAPPDRGNGTGQPAGA